MEQPTFQPLSELLKAWDKTNCLFCTAPATRSAVLGRSEMRCCGSEVCGEHATKFALRSEEILAEAEV